MIEGILVLLASFAVAYGVATWIQVAAKSRGR